MRRPPRVPLVRPSKLLWVPALVLGAASIWFFGLPHMLWNYEYVGRMEPRHFTSCEYLGPYPQRVTPHDGKCPFILMLRTREETP